MNSPSWTDMSTNRLVFSGNISNLATTVAAGSFQDGTHLGSGTPGTDQCGSNHAPNVKLLTATTMSLNGGGSLALSDGNLPDNSCSFRIHFNDVAGYQLQNGRLYTYDGSTTTTQAVGVDAAVYIKGASMTQWATLNSDTTVGPAIASMSFQTAAIGGNRTSNYVTLPNQSANVDHYYYVALSVSPESSGSKSSFAMGAYLEFF